MAAGPPVMPGPLRSTNELGRIIAPQNKLATKSCSGYLRSPAIQLPLLTVGARPCLLSKANAFWYQLLFG